MVIKPLMLATELTHCNGAYINGPSMFRNIISKLRLIGDIIEIPITLSTGDRINIIRIFYENARTDNMFISMYMSGLNDVIDRKSILYEDLMKDCLDVGIALNSTMNYDIINGHVSFEIPEIGDIISDILVDCDCEYDLKLNVHGDEYLWEKLSPGRYHPLWINMLNERNRFYVGIKITLKSFTNDAVCAITFGAVNIFNEGCESLLRENLFLANNEAIVINK